MGRGPERGATRLAEGLCVGPDFAARRAVRKALSPTPAFGAPKALRRGASLQPLQPVSLKRDGLGVRAGRCTRAHA